MIVLSLQSLLTSYHRATKQFEKILSHIVIQGEREILLAKIYINILEFSSLQSKIESNWQSFVTYTSSDSHMIRESFIVSR